MPEKLKAKYAATKILVLDRQERLEKGLPHTDKMIARHVGVTRDTIDRWKKEIPQTITEMEKPKVTTDILGDALHDYDSDTWLKENIKKVNKALIKSCDAGSPASLKIYYQLTKQLIEESKITHEISADEVARRNLEAARQLRESGY